MPDLHDYNLSFQQSIKGRVINQHPTQFNGFVVYFCNRYDVVNIVSPFLLVYHYNW